MADITPASRGERGGAREPAQVEVRRSRKRRSTVTAYRDGDRTIVLIPARFTVAQENEWVSRMLGRLSAQEKRRRPGDDQLIHRAAVLSDRYLGGLARPASVSWVTNQNSRWGSCTPADRTIRLSTRLLGMPPWVIDYVLLHELAHLIQPGHGERFWSLLDAYPRTERARGFLEGVAVAKDLPDMSDDDSGAGSVDGFLDGHAELDTDDRDATSDDSEVTDVADGGANSGSDRRTDDAS